MTAQAEDPRLAGGGGSSAAAAPRQPDEPPRLWTPADLAAFLGYTERTVLDYASRRPERLPPRVRHLLAPRWVPAVCQAWAVAGSTAPGAGSAAPVRRKVGRPRLPAD